MYGVGDRIARWSRLLLEFGLSQGLAQTAGMLSGLIYVRLMPIDQYAFYAIGLSSLSFISVASDMGLSGSLGYFWRESSKDGSPIEPIISAVRRLRWAFLILAALVSGVLLLKSTAKQDLPITSVLACFGIVIATASFQMQATIDLSLIRLRGMQRQSYYCDAAGSIVRLLAAVAMVVTDITTALFGLAGGLFGSLSIVAALRGFAPTSAPKSQPIRLETWRKLRRYIMPLVPTTIVYMAQDPLIYWLTLT